MSVFVTCDQLLQGVVPYVCVFCGSVVEVQRIPLKPLPSPLAAEQSHTEHGPPRLLSRRPPPLHLHCIHILQQQYTWLRDARLTCTERGRLNTRTECTQC